MSAVTRCILQSLLKLPASNDDDTLLLLPSLLVGSAAQLRSLLQVRSAASISPITSKQVWLFSKQVWLSSKQVW